eukprot:4826351-Pyramimonas_sp.AAC.1
MSLAKCCISQPIVTVAGGKVRAARNPLRAKLVPGKGLSSGTHRTACRVHASATDMGWLLAAVETASNGVEYGAVDAPSGALLG